MATTVTFYTSGDGVAAQADSSGSTWALRRAGPGTRHYSSPTNNYDFECNSNGSYWQIYRGCQPFDTSSLPDNATISSATFNMYSTGAGGHVDNQSIYLIGTSLTTITANGDFVTANFDFTKDYGHVAQTTWSNGAGWGALSLSSNGLSFINKTGMTYFGMCYSLDRSGDSTAPTGLNYFNYRSSSYASYVPYLSVTYDVPTSGTGNFLAFM